MRKLLNRLRKSSGPEKAEGPEAEFAAAARDLVEANRAARAAGYLHTEEMEAAGARLRAAEERLKRARADSEAVAGGPEPVGLTPLVARKVRRSFPPGEQAEAIRLLENECARNLPFCAESTAEGLERVRLDVLKLAGGSLEELRRQVGAAKRDWRDVILLAESPESVRLGLVEVGKLDAAARREVQERDRRQYLAWLREGEEEEDATPER